jgi:CheY-like chemotaxis protein
MPEKTQTLRFLVIDVDPAARSQLESWIVDGGLGEVIVSDNLRDGVRILDTQDITCVICAWTLLGISHGLSLLKLIKFEDRFKKIRFVMISSPSDQEAAKVKAARAAHTDGYLLKPLNEQSVRSLLIEVLPKQHS